MKLIRWKRNKNCSGACSCLKYAIYALRKTFIEEYTNSVTSACPKRKREALLAEIEQQETVLKQLEEEVSASQAAIAAQEQIQNEIQQLQSDIQGAGLRLIMNCC